MGSILLSRSELMDYLQEIVGFKAGIALTKDELRDLMLTSDAKQWFNEPELLSDDEQGIRIRSEELEQLGRLLLYRAGNVPTPEPPPPASYVLEKFPDKIKDVSRVLALVGECLKDYVASNGDFTEVLLERLQQVQPPIDMKVARLLLIKMAEAQHYDLFSRARRVEFSDAIPIADLFGSEEISLDKDRFIDQRYIDYLAANTDDLYIMNWRKFEALTADFFKQEGFEVELGPGRGDGGIDIRVWRSSNTEEAPLVIIQCKRLAQGNLVKINEIKALGFDRIDAGAEQALMVTTSKIAKGGKRICYAHRWELSYAEHDNVVDWLQRLRTEHI